MAHLGYLQIDPIYVIERSHHHILYTRIPAYRREHLHQAQSIDKTIFEYWTHALSYVPTESLRFYVRHMRRAGGADWERRNSWFGKVSKVDLRRVLSRIRRHGALTIRDIEDEPVEKDYAWASRKPSKRVLEMAFYKGLLTISQRAGMLKTYELMTRHFGWNRLPRAATESETFELPVGSCAAIAGNREPGIDLSSGLSTKACDEASAGVASPSKGADPGATGRRGRIAALGPPEYSRCYSRSGAGTNSYPLALRPADYPAQAARLFFDYEYRFEAYVPKHKRVFGYFCCPVLIGDRIVAALDLKTDRSRQELLVQSWNWIGRASLTHRKQVEAALHKFERFQLSQS